MPQVMFRSAKKKLCKAGPETIATHGIDCDGKPLQPESLKP
jgi:hypothetical protein